MIDKQVVVKKMDKYLTPLDVWGIAFGCMVGWGAFVMPGSTFLPVAGPAGTTIALVASLFTMLTIGCNVSYLMQREPRTGGIYSYTKEAFGRDHAFLCLWFLCLSYLTIVFLNATALFVVLRTMLNGVSIGGVVYTINGNSVYLFEILISVISIAGIGILFIFAKPFLQRLQTILALILFIGAFITTLFCLPHADFFEIFTSFGFKDIDSKYAIFSLVILAPWAFVGFEVVSFDTAHFRFPIRKSKVVIALSIILGAFVYISMTFVSICVVPDGYSSWKAYIADLDNLDGILAIPTFYVAKEIMGTAGFAVMGGTALAAIMTGIIGAYRAALRVLSTMAEDKIISDKFSVTTYSIVFIMVLSSVVSLMGSNTLKWFIDLTSFGAVVAYAYTSASSFKMAMTEGNRRIMATGLTGMAIAILFGAVQIIPRLTALEAMCSEAFLLMSLWCLLGFIFYWRTIEYSLLSEYSGISISGTLLFGFLVYTALMWLGNVLYEKENMEEVRHTLFGGGIIILLLIFFGFAVMLYVQNLIRIKHEASEREKIRAVERSIAKSQFLFNMSHDIRTPMNAILGYINIALHEYNSELQHNYLIKIKESSKCLLNIINDILEMSRIENGNIQLSLAPVDLCEILNSTFDLFTAQMKQKQINFSVHTSQVQHIYVWCDEKSLNRVLLNLLSNAYKFTPAGGTVSASLYEISGADDGYCSYELRVQDSGIGMSKEFVERMWDAFERERTSTDSGVEGTGLGLAITKRIVDLMGGTIEVLTSPGNGTKFILHFKFRLASKEELHKKAPTDEFVQETTENFTGKRLLLVEDNIINVELAKKILKHMGFLLETAENGQVAVNMVSASQPGYYDAILMDIQMPVMDGYAATKAIRSLDNADLARIPILAMTANAFQEDVQVAKNAGMQAHIAKPIDIGDLKNKLLSVLKS